MICAPSDSIILAFSSVAYHQPLPFNLSTEGCKPLYNLKKLRYCSNYTISKLGKQDHFMFKDRNEN